MITPILTEKSLNQATHGKYTFSVNRSMTKYQIRKAVNDLFNVHTKSVATMNYKKLVKKNNKGKFVTTAGFKKAIVTLAAGETIAIFGGSKKDK